MTAAPPNQKVRNILPLLLSGLLLVALARLAVVMPVPANAVLPSLLFLVLIIFTSTFGAPLAGGVMSLLPMTTVAAFLVVGLVPASWLAFFGAFINGYIRFHFAGQLGFPPSDSRSEAFTRAAAEATVQTVSILAAGAIYLLIGGALPLNSLDRPALLIFAATALCYLAMSYVMNGLFLSIREASRLNMYIRLLPGILFYEGIPLVFAPLVALSYNVLGLEAFVLFGFAIVAAALVMRNLALSRRRLERQLRELDSLHAVGQALSSSLNLHAVLLAVYQQVFQIMPVETFYVALYDPENDEVVFPLVVENGVEEHWPSQRYGRGLAEHLMRPQNETFQREKTDVLRRTFGLSVSQRPVTSWLGVPIPAGDSLLGVISVQSHSKFNLYDTTHEEVLTAIASQASLAIQNARLYARTDQALARRIQELDSILRTVKEGILLLDLSYRVVALNRALADFLGLPTNEVIRTSLVASQKAEVHQLLDGIGYSSDQLVAECEALLKPENEVKKTIITLRDADSRQVERTLTAVRDRMGEVTGWLVVFRDLTEEIELQQLRDDMMHMLVHDLRSPLAVVQSSLSSIPAFLEKGKLDGVRKLVDYSERGVQRVLGLVTDILDIARLESGNMPLHPTLQELPALLQEAAHQISPLAKQAGISIRVSAPKEFPSVNLDAHLLGRVLSNLLDNAVKFTPKGGRIDLWAAEGLYHPRPMVWIGVSDSGPGIPVDKREQLFEKFHQLEAPGGRRAGTGLGLHYCKLAVEAHGGKISVESFPNQGSTFVIQLPVNPPGTCPDA